MKIKDRMLTLLSLLVIILFVLESVGMFEVAALATVKTVPESTMTEETQQVEETVVETVPETTIPEETIPEFVYEEQIPMVPQYFQQDYAHIKYGNHGTVSSHGCGITSVAMVFSYLFDEPILPDRMAGEYGYKNFSGGSCWTLFPDSGADYGLEVIQTGNWKEVKEALKRGQVVIANARSNTIFTSGGHYIVLAGMTEDGRVIVRDPNRYNFGLGETSILTIGFTYGFEEKYVHGCTQYWIYPHKDYAKLSADAEAEYYAQFN